MDWTLENVAYYFFVTIWEKFFCFEITIFGYTFPIYMFFLFSLMVDLLALLIYELVD